MVVQNSRYVHGFPKNRNAADRSVPQCRIVIDKADGIKSQLGVLPQLTKNQLTSASGAVDQCGPSMISAPLARIVQHTIGAPNSSCKKTEEQDIDHKETHGSFRRMMDHHEGIRNGSRCTYG